MTSLIRLTVQTRPRTRRRFAASMLPGVTDILEARVNLSAVFAGGVDFDDDDDNDRDGDDHDENEVDDDAAATAATGGMQAHSRSFDFSDGGSDGGSDGASDHDDDDRTETSNSSPSDGGASSTGSTSTPITIPQTDAESDGGSDDADSSESSDDNVSSDTTPPQSPAAGPEPEAPSESEEAESDSEASSHSESEEASDPDSESAGDDSSASGDDGADSPGDEGQESTEDSGGDASDEQSDTDPESAETEALLEAVAALTDGTAEASRESNGNGAVLTSAEADLKASGTDESEHTDETRSEDAATQTRSSTSKSADGLRPVTAKQEGPESETGSDAEFQLEVRYSAAGDSLRLIDGDVSAEPLVESSTLLAGLGAIPQSRNLAAGILAVAATVGLRSWWFASRSRRTSQSSGFREPVVRRSRPARTTAEIGRVETTRMN